MVVIIVLRNLPILPRKIRLYCLQTQHYRKKKQAMEDMNTFGSSMP